MVDNLVKATKQVFELLSPLEGRIEWLLPVLDFLTAVKNDPLLDSKGFDVAAAIRHRYLHVVSPAITPWEEGFQAFRYKCPLLQDLGKVRE